MTRLRAEKMTSFIALRSHDPVEYSAVLYQIRSPVRVAILRNPVEGSRPGETSHFLAREALHRGHAVCTFTPDRLRWEEGAVLAEARPIAYEGTNPLSGPPAEVDLASMDVVLVRHDPPTDLAWLSPLWLLDQLPPRSSSPTLRRCCARCPTSWGSSAFPGLIPPTLVTAEGAQLRAFRDRHSDIVLKPLFDKGGAGVFVFGRDDDNFDVVLDSWLPMLGHPVMAQAWVAAAQPGPVRVMVVDGRPLGALRSVPRPGQRRTGMDSSQAVVPHVLDPGQLHTVSQVAEELGRRGVLLAGLDLVGDRLIELNLTSPGGEVYYNCVYSEPLAPRVWEALEARVTAIGATMSSVEMGVSSSRMTAPAKRPPASTAQTIG